MKDNLACPMIQKLSSVYVLAHSGFVSSLVLFYGRRTIDFRIVVFAKTRWLFPYGITFPPDSRGSMLFYSVC